MIISLHAPRTWRTSANRLRASEHCSCNAWYQITFTYNVPSRPSLPPRPVDTPTQVNPLDSLVSSSSPAVAQAPPSSSPNKNAGVEAREKVLEAIAPMRRGRPTQLQSSSRSTSPTKEASRGKRLLKASFSTSTQTRTLARLKSLRGEPSKMHMEAYVGIGRAWRAQRRGKCSMGYRMTDGLWDGILLLTGIAQNPPQSLTALAMPLEILLRTCLEDRRLQPLRLHHEWPNLPHLVPILLHRDHQGVSRVVWARQNPRMLSTTLVSARSKLHLRSVRFGLRAELA